MERRPRVDYDSITVTCENEPGKEALLNYYCLLIDFLIEKFDRDLVRTALEELIAEQ